MTTTTAFTPQQKLTMIKHLAGGKTADVVATIMHTTRDTVVDVARGHGYPDTDKLAWAADVLAKNIDQGDALPERPMTAGGTVERPRPVVPGSQPIAAPPAATRPDEIRVLLNTAKAHPSKRIQSAADRVFDQLNKLNTLIKEDHEKNAEKRKADAAKAAARAEVEHLEAQLAAAKAKLRGKPTTAPAAAAEPKAATSTTPRGEYPCRNQPCTSVYDSPQGRSMHERMHCEHRTQAAS